MPCIANIAWIGTDRQLFRVRRFSLEDGFQRTTGCSRVGIRPFWAFGHEVPPLPWLMG